MKIIQDYKKISNILRHSITRKLLFVAFSIYMLLTIIVTAFHMDFEYNFSKKQTIAALKNLQSMIHDSISQAIWEFNTKQIDTILNGLYNNEFLVGVKLQIDKNAAIPELDDKEIGLVEGDNGQLLFFDPNTKQETVVNDTLERLIPDEFNIYHIDSTDRKLIIGKMSLYSSNKVVFNQVKDSFLLLIYNAIIKTTGLWIFFLWAGYYYVSKPLIQLTSAIKKLADGDWNTALAIADIKDKQKTEIHTLFESFNNMTKKLFTTQDKLQQSRNRLTNIFDTMPSALISVNYQYIIQGWNKYMVKQTGIEANQAIGKSIVEVYNAFNDYLYLIPDSLKNNKENHLKNAKIIKDENSKNRLYDITTYPIKNSQMSEVVIRIDDVTEQVTNEANLAQVEKLASVGASIAGVAHEINNPLGSIMQGTQNIIRRLDPNLEANQTVANEFNIDLKVQYKYLEKREIVGFLNSLREAGERASSIVKNMLKFTRRSAGEMSCNDLISIINDGIQLAATDVSLQERSDFKKINITKEFFSDHVMIDCHPMEIQQVILNLLKNAAHALEGKEGKEGKKQIKIILNQVDNDKVCLEISDNGQGMSDEVKSKLFQPFFTTKPAGQGTGLGLSICRNIIVQKHFGQMLVESTLGVGTTFTIILPIHKQNYA